MFEISINIDDVIKKLDHFPSEVAEALVDGVTECEGFVRAHMVAGHGPGAHSQGRFQNVSTNLVSQTKVVPVKIVTGAVLGGVVAHPPYARPVEKLYPFGEPAAHDPEVIRKCKAALKAHLTRRLRLK